jgi:hypothetical protein
MGALHHKQAGGSRKGFCSTLWYISLLDRGGLPSMTRITKLFLAVLVVFSGLAFGSCSKSDDGKGPMEKAGKALDDSMEKAKEQTGRAMEKTGAAIKEAGEKMQDSAKAEKKQ